MTASASLMVRLSREKDASRDPGKREVEGRGCDAGTGMFRLVNVMRHLSSSPAKKDDWAGVTVTSSGDD